MNARHFVIPGLAALACALSGCAQHHAAKPGNSDRPFSMPIMPLAQGHIPPVWTPQPAGAEVASIPIRIAGVTRRGRRVRIAWDAPGATAAVLAFSVDGTAFRILARTGEPAAELVPGAPHGIIRVYVTDGKRHGSADYRL